MKIPKFLNEWIKADKEAYPNLRVFCKKVTFNTETWKTVFSLSKRHVNFKREYIWLIKGNENVSYVSTYLDGGITGSTDLLKKGRISTACGYLDSPCSFIALRRHHKDCEIDIGGHFCNHKAMEDAGKLTIGFAFTCTNEKE